MRLAGVAAGLALLAAGPVAAQGVDADPAETRCQAAPAVVLVDAGALEQRLVCDGAARALRFLGDAGLRLPELTRVHLVDEMPGEMAGRAVGCYLRDTRRVMLLRWSAFEATGHWLRWPVEPALYRGAAAHEMAHAVVGCHVDDRALPVTAHELVAYVTLFATLDADLRERVLARFGGHGFDTPLQINPIVYVADPLQFGADAWRHYRRQRDGAAWLRDVVAGLVVPEFPTDAP
ncbi:MAG: DUF6639 family protein [Rubrivivax sp.]